MTPAVEAGHGHPTWCDARHCEALAGGLIHHRSAPNSWFIDGGHAEVVVCRAQYDDHVPHEPIYHIQICRLDVEGESIEFEWSGNDTRYLQAQLEHLGGLS